MGKLTHTHTHTHNINQAKRPVGLPAADGHQLTALVAARHVVEDGRVVDEGVQLPVTVATAQEEGGEARGEVGMGRWGGGKRKSVSEVGACRTLEGRVT